MKTPDAKSLILGSAPSDARGSSEARCFFARLLMTARSGSRGHSGARLKQFLSHFRGFFRLVASLVAEDIGIEKDGLPFLVVSVGGW